MVTLNRTNNDLGILNSLITDQFPVALQRVEF